MKNKGDKIIGVYLLKAQLTLASPLMIASGESDDADKEVVLYQEDRDKQKRAYIPASSFAGVLLSEIRNLNGSLKNQSDSIAIEEGVLDYIAGSSEGYQSHFIPEDLLSFDIPQITTRDGVAISNETGTAIKGAKYDYQIIEPGITFHFKAMIKVRAEMEEKDITSFLHYLNYLLSDDVQFAFGANTNNGFGRFSSTGLEVAHFSFPADADSYFSYLASLNTFTERNGKYYGHFPTTKPSLFDNVAYTCERNQFEACINFTVKTNTIIGSNQDSDTDKSTLLSNGIPVLSGKSIRGSVINVMDQILEIHSTNAIPDECKLKVDKRSLLGHEHIGDNDYKNARLLIEEVRLPEATTQKYTRNKIDRFTGGTIAGALFDSKPIEAGQTFDIKFTIKKPTLPEVQLLVMTIRELWVGRLTLGGEKAIGRGVLQGNRGTMSHKASTIKFNSVKELKEQWNKLQLI